MPGIARRPRSLATWATCALLLAAAPNGKTDEGPVGPRDPWIRIETDRFTLFSDAAEDKARRVAANLETFGAALARLTRGVRQTSPVPTYVYVFKGDRSFEPYRFDPGIRGFFRARPEGNYIALIERPPIRPSQRSHQEHASYYWGTVYHEYVHFMLTVNFPNVPFWLHEGLAEYYYTFRVAGDGIEVGRALPSHLDRLRHPGGARWIPVERLVAGDFTGSGERERTMAYAESWALTHFLLSGGKSAAVNAYLENLSRGRPTQEAFGDVFGSDLEALDRDLRRYVRQPRFRFARVEVSSLEVPPVPAAVAMEPADALYRLGMLALTTHDPHGHGLAAEHFTASIRSDPSCPGGHLGLALIDELEGRSDEAGDHLEQAARLDRDDGTAHFYYGIHVLAGLAEADEAQAERIIGLAREEFRKCVEMVPDFVEPYYLYGLTYLYGVGDPAEGIPALRHARSHLPSRMDVALDLVFLHLSAEDPDSARQVVLETLLTRGPLLVSYLNREAMDNLIGFSLGRFARIQMATALIREVLPSVPDATLRAEIESELRRRFPLLEDPHPAEE